MRPDSAGAASGDLWHNRRIITFSLLAMATSGFGQTFFVAVFGAEIRDAFDLSHTHYGLIYSLATILSAILLLHAGTWADTWRLPRVTTTAVLLLALGCALIGLAPHVAVLATGFLLVRFAGQGLIAHIGLTTAARRFRAHRGKAVAFAAAGIPLAEATLPAAGVLVLGWLGGWRAPWLMAVAVLLLVAWPALLVLARNAGPAQASTNDAATAESAEGPDFTRRQALRDPGLYMLLPAKMAAPFIVTAILFHQAALAEARGWPLELVATAFTVFAAGHLATLFAAGYLVDRMGAQRALPLALVPMTLGMAALASVTSTWGPFLYLGLTGITLGGIATVGGAIWAERYGTRHLGAIRSVAQAVMVVSTAVAPVALGAVLDLGWTVATIGTVLGVATAAVAALATLAPNPARRAPSPGERDLCRQKGSP